MRISDWSSYVCSSERAGAEAGTDETGAGAPENDNDENADDGARDTTDSTEDAEPDASHTDALDANNPETAAADGDADPSTDPSQDDTNTHPLRSEENTSEPPSLMRQSYAAICHK